MEKTLWKIGEIAKLAQVTVRTLHYYEEVGLLAAVSRSQAGYRFYDQRALERLQMIRLLQQVGFSLEDIKRAILEQKLSLVEVLPLHIKKLREQILKEENICQRLESFARLLEGRNRMSFVDLTELIKLTASMNSYFTDEQNEEIKKRGEVVGQERIKEVENRWPTLIAAVREHMDKGTDPKDPAVQELAKEWMGLVGEFTGGNPAIEAGLNKMYQEKGPELREQFGPGIPTPDMYPYIQKALS